jgi:hypothetical protein
MCRVIRRGNREKQPGALFENQCNPRFQFMQSLPQYLAAALIKGTRKHLSTLMGDYLEETKMSKATSCTTTGIRVGDNETSRTPIGGEIPDTPQSLAADSPAKLPGASGSDSINSGFTCGSQLPTLVTQPVDRRTLAGSTPGDFRQSGDSARASMDQIANPPNPRAQMRGQRNSKNYAEDGSHTVVTERPMQVGE